MKGAIGNNKRRRSTCFGAMFVVGVIFSVVIGVVLWGWQNLAWLFNSDREDKLFLAARDDNPRSVIKYMNDGVYANVRDDRDRTPVPARALHGRFAPYVGADSGHHR